MSRDQQLAWYCFMIFVKYSESEDLLSVDKLDQKENKEMDEPAKQQISILLREDDPVKTVQIGSQLSDLEQK